MDHAMSSGRRIPVDGRASIDGEREDTLGFPAGLLRLIPFGLLLWALLAWVAVSFVF